jgi:hypothetical protein
MPTTRPVCALLLSALLPPEVSAIPQQSTHDYAVMFDAGSSGTRCHVYRWPSQAACGARLADQLVVEVGEGLNAQPGLSTFADNLSGVAEYLHPLIESARQQVPEGVRGETPLYLQATAGMRLLPDGEQEAILGAVREAFADSGFQASPGDALVVSGAVEGANEWTTVNYLRGALGPAGLAVDLVTARPAGGKSRRHPNATAAVLGMGGASTQIAFVPLAGTELKAGEIPPTATARGAPPCTSHHLTWRCPSHRVWMVSRRLPPGAAGSGAHPALRALLPRARRHRGTADLADVPGARWGPHRARSVPAERVLHDRRGECNGRWMLGWVRVEVTVMLPGAG